jgi:hypothetical protein
LLLWSSGVAAAIAELFVVTLEDLPPPKIPL